MSLLNYSFASAFSRTKVLSTRSTQIDFRVKSNNNNDHQSRYRSEKHHQWVGELGAGRNSAFLKLHTGQTGIVQPVVQ